MGIWHETYRIGPGQYESVYSGMPAFGLDKAGRLLPAEGRRERARSRMYSDEPATAAPEQHGAAPEEAQ
ncbi:monooxygenase family protein [Kallotenue papyrolyticum]|uniref:monooxygenase family protein n=1 Tax=Kallotenue papyrolyticum TaxID=1325125 RepID=UPI0004AE3CF5